MFCCKKTLDTQDTESEMVKGYQPENKNKEDNKYKEITDVSPVEFVSYLDEREDHGHSPAEISYESSNKKKFKHRNMGNFKPPYE